VPLTLATSALSLGLAAGVVGVDLLRGHSEDLLLFP
jgi:hypothetical protein